MDININELFKSLAQYKVIADEANTQAKTIQKQITDYMTEEGKETLI